MAEVKILDIVFKERIVEEILELRFDIFRESFLGGGNSKEISAVEV